MKSKHYNDEVSLSNTPHLKEKTIVLGLAHFFIGVNFLLYGAVYSTAVEVLFGIVFLLLVPIIVFDKRRENRGTFAVVCACIIHLCECVYLSVIHSIWWMLVYVGEAIAIFLIAYYSHTQIKIK